MCHTAPFSHPNATLRRKRGLGEMGAATTKKKRVRFACDESYGPDRAPLTKEEIDDVWYTDEEHDGMRYQARVDCWVIMAEIQRKTQYDGAAPPPRCPQHMQGDGGETPCYRGLEARLSFHRSHNRRVAAKAVLEVQSRLRDGRATTKHDPELVLGMLAAKLTVGAGSLAREVGDADFRAAYGMTAEPQAAAPVLAPLVVDMQTGTRNIKRMARDSHEGGGRRVRMRVEVEATAS